MGMHVHLGGGKRVFHDLADAQVEVEQVELGELRFERGDGQSGVDQGT